MWRVCVGFFYHCFPPFAHRTSCTNCLSFVSQPSIFCLLAYFTFLSTRFNLFFVSRIICIQIFGKWKKRKTTISSKPKKTTTTNSRFACRLNKWRCVFVFAMHSAMREFITVDFLGGERIFMATNLIAQIHRIGFQIFRIHSWNSLGSLFSRFLVFFRTKMLTIYCTHVHISPKRYFR